MAGPPLLCTAAGPAAASSWAAGQGQGWSGGGGSWLRSRIFLPPPRGLPGLARSLGLWSSVPHGTIGEGDVEGAAQGAGNSWAADSLERLLMKPVPGCEGYGQLSSSAHPLREGGERGRPAEAQTRRSVPSIPTVRYELVPCEGAWGQETRETLWASSLLPSSHP